MVVWYSTQYALPPPRRFRNMFVFCCWQPGSPGQQPWLLFPLPETGAIGKTVGTIQANCVDTERCAWNLPASDRYDRPLASQRQGQEVFSRVQNVAYLHLNGSKGNRYTPTFGLALKLCTSYNIACTLFYYHFPPFRTKAYPCLPIWIAPHVVQARYQCLSSFNSPIRPTAEHRVQQ